MSPRLQHHRPYRFEGGARGDHREPLHLAGLRSVLRELRDLSHQAGHAEEVKLRVHCKQRGALDQERRLGAITDHAYNLRSQEVAESIK